MICPIFATIGVIVTIIAAALALIWFVDRPRKKP